MHGQRRHQLRMPQRHKSRHAGARRQAGDVHARRIQAMTPHFRADQRGDQVGLAAAVQRVGLEPAPAALHLPGHGLLRVQHHEAGRVGPLVHARTLRERQRGLATAVQHDHQRHALARHAGRNVAGEGETPAQAVGELARGLPAAQAQRGRGAVARGIGAAPGRRPARRGGALAGGAGHGQVQGRALDPAELFAALKNRVEKLRAIVRPRPVEPCLPQDDVPIPPGRSCTAADCLIRRATDAGFAACAQ